MKAKFSFTRIFFPLLILSAVLTGSASEVSAGSGPNPLGVLDAVVLGIVEGVTEYLPVSSTGHLLLTQHAMGLADTPDKKRSADAYAVIIQIGAILAVLGIYRQRVCRILLGCLGKDPDGLKLAVALIIAFLPAALSGFLFEDMIKKYLFGPWPVALGWIVGGIAIFFVPADPGRIEYPETSKSIEAIGVRIALFIGLFQMFALWPGISRSLATIAGGLIAGLSLGAAVEFSFLLGLITLGAATVYEFIQQGGRMLTEYGFLSPSIGILSAFISAWISVKWLIGYLKRNGLHVFGYYRIILGLLTGVLLFTHLI